MDKLDRMINEALSSEDEALLERYGREPGYFDQAFSLFRGRLGWVMWLLAVLQLLLFVVAVYGLWQVFTATELMHALRWGVGAVVMVQLSVLFRSFMGMHFQTNRVLRELKRVELRVVRLESRDAVSGPEVSSGTQG